MVVVYKLAGSRFQFIRSRSLVDAVYLRIYIPILAPLVLQDLYPDPGLGDSLFIF